MLLFNMADKAAMGHEHQKETRWEVKEKQQLRAVELP